MHDGVSPAEKTNLSAPSSPLSPSTVPTVGVPAKAPVFASSPTVPSQVSPVQARQCVATPVPWRSLAILCMILVNETVAATMLMPFIGLLVAHIQGISPDEAGYSSGVLIALFHTAQIFCNKAWGRASDVVGRRPVMMMGLFFSTIIMVIFGFSNSIAMAAVVRFLHGLFNGNVGVAKTVVGEVTDKSNEAKGFATISLAYGVGSIIGPSAGGVLFDPCRSKVLPIVPSCDGLFGQFPALLPCLIAAVYSGAAFLLAYFYMPETNTRAKSSSSATLVRLAMWWHKRAPQAATSNVVASGGATLVNGQSAPQAPALTNGGASSSSIGNAPSSVNGGSHAVTPTSIAARRHVEVRSLLTEQPEAALGSPKRPSGKALSVMDILRDDSIRTASLMYIIACGGDALWLETLPLWLISSSAVGGLGLNADAVGLIILIGGISVITANLTFPMVTTRFGNRMLMFRVCLIFWSLVTVLTPASSLMPPNLVIPFMFATTFARNLLGSWIFSLTYLFIARSCPRREHLGTVNGAAQAGGSIAKMLYPLLGAPIFAYSVSGNHVFPMNHFLVFVIGAVTYMLVYVASIGFVVGDETPSGKGNGRTEEQCPTCGHSPKRHGLDAPAPASLPPLLMGSHDVLQQEVPRHEEDEVLLPEALHGGAASTSLAPTPRNVEVTDGAATAAGPSGPTEGREMTTIRITA